eukprot:2074069-Amphidinium_carterae.1
MITRLCAVWLKATSLRLRPCCIDSHAIERDKVPRVCETMHTMGTLLRVSMIQMRVRVHTTVMHHSSKYFDMVAELARTIVNRA